MPVKKRGKVSAKRKMVVVPPVAPTPPLDVQSEPEEEEHADPDPELESVGTPETDGGDPRSQVVREKGKRVYNNFPERQKELLVEWLLDNPIMYNKCLKEYKNKEKKTALWTEIALKLGLSEDLVHKWYKTMRTQFGKLVQKKSGDAAREHTDREKWILTKFAFLRSHIVRVASRQTGFLKGKLGHTTSSNTAAQPSDESDMDDEEEEISINQESGEGPPQSTTAASTVSVPAPPKGKKKKKTSPDTELHELIGKLTEKVQDSQNMGEKVAEMVKAVENPHTAYGNYLTSMHPSIHPDLWDDYLRKSHDTLLSYVAESKQMLRQHRVQQERQPQMQQFGTNFSQLQPLATQQPHSSLGSVSTQPGGTAQLWDTCAPMYGNPDISTPNPANVSQTSQFSVGSFMRNLDDINTSQQGADHQNASGSQKQ